MKRTLLIMTLIAGALQVSAQHTNNSDIYTDSAAPYAKDFMLKPSKCDLKKGDSRYIKVGTGGTRISTPRRDSIRATKTVNTQWLMLDLGINALDDRTDYTLPGARQYLQVPDEGKNGNLFALRPAKSVNVNIWPVLFNVKLLHNKHQKLSFYTGVGLQLYNFRFNKDISYRNETSPVIIQDSIHFKKNKLAFAYASIPLMLNGKTRMGMSDLWLVYGFGVIGGYALDSWTKQVSEERGKQKNHDPFNFQKFNCNLSAEIGVDGYIRLYATYQVTNLYRNGLVQHPFAIGIRFFGI